jgi:hypothetical protein
MATKTRSGKRKTTTARRKSTTGSRRAGGTRRGAAKPAARRATAAKRSPKRTTKRTSARARTTSGATRARAKETTTSEGVVTTDHNVIRRWVEERGGQPACVRGTGDADDVGLLRIDFPGGTGAESLQPISWDEFFDKFDERKLAFLHHQPTRDGGRSYFNKLIDRRTPSRGRQGRAS